MRVSPGGRGFPSGYTRYGNATKNRYHDKSRLRGFSRPPVRKGLLANIRIACLTVLY